MRRSAYLSVVTGSLLFAGTASAQEAMLEGPGVKLGEGAILHPSFGVATGLIHNVFYEENDPVTAGVLRLLADFVLGPAVPDPEPDPLGTERGLSGQGTIDLRGGLNLTYEEYLTSNDNVRDQRNLGIAADVGFVAFPRGKFSFYIKDRFQRVIRPTNFE